MVDIQKPIIFLYSRNKQVEFDSKRKNTIYVSSKKNEILTYNYNKIVRTV